MPLLARVSSLLRNLTRSREVEAELDDELKALFQMVVDEKVRLGVPPRDARRQARLELGGIEGIKEGVRQERMGHLLVCLGGDLRYAFRLLSRSPGFAAASLLTLALGIGANTAIFSLVQTLLLSPLPYRQADRLVLLRADLGAGPEVAFSFPEWHELRARCRSLEDAAAVVATARTVVGEPESERVRVGRVSWNFFSLLGAGPAIGRDFAEEMDVFGGAPVAIISHSLWQRRFHGDPGIVGRTLRLSDGDRAILGVMPDGFRHPMPTETSIPDRLDVWVPLQLDPESFLARRDVRWLSVVARLGVGSPASRATAELREVSRVLAAEHEEYSGGGLAVDLAPLHGAVVASARSSLLVLSGAVTVVLLIACANVANLSLARLAARKREMALRRALGASDGRVVSQLMTESLLIAVGGGALGLLFAELLLGAILSLAPRGLLLGFEPGIDAGVLLFACLATLVTGLLFGLAPGLVARRGDLSLRLGGARGSAADGDPQGWRKAAVTIEVALALVLTIVSGLLVASFASLQRVDLGFDTENLFTFEVPLFASEYDQPQVLWRFHRGLERALSSVSGVRAAGAISHLPLTGEGMDSPFSYDEESEARWGALRAHQRLVTPGFLEAAGATLLRGRWLTAGDFDGLRRVAIVDDGLERRIFPGESAVGKRIKVDVAAQGVQEIEIVGVVRSLRLLDAAAASARQIYLPSTLAGWRGMSYVVRTAGPLPGLHATVRELVRDLDAEVPVARARLMSRVVAESLSSLRFVLALMTGFALVAGSLAMVGTAGVVSYRVAERRREIGVRRALGADTRSVLTLVLGEISILLAVGLGAGLVLALLVTRLLRSLLHGVHPVEPTVFLGAVTVLLVTTLLGCFGPARRAIRIHPATALREE